MSEFVFDAQGILVSGPVPLVEYVGAGRATASALAAGPDGLYFADLYKDFGAATPIDAGANVFRIRYVGVADFTADTAVGQAAALGRLPRRVFGSPRDRVALGFRRRGLERGARSDPRVRLPRQLRRAPDRDGLGRARGAPEGRGGRGFVAGAQAGVLPGPARPPAACRRCRRSELRAPVPAGHPGDG